MAEIDELFQGSSDEHIHISNKLSTLSFVEDKTYIWLLDSGASSHLCCNIELSDSIVDIPLISILFEMENLSL